MSATLDYLTENSEEFRLLAEAQRIIASLPAGERETVRRLVRMALRDGYASGTWEALKEPNQRELPGKYADGHLWQYVDRLPVPDADQSP